jgi:CheY-like chemotaxis protein
MSPDLSGLVVMVIDDDDFMLEVVSELLRQMGVGEVIPVSDGWSALAFVDDGAVQPDVMLLDLSLDGMHGTEMLRHLASRNFEGTLVVMSGSSDALLRSASTLAADYGLTTAGEVAKPVDPSRLRAVLERVALAQVGDPSDH